MGAGAAVGAATLFGIGPGLRSGRPWCSRGAVFASSGGLAALALEGGDGSGDDEADAVGVSIGEGGFAWADALALDGAATLGCGGTALGVACRTSTSTTAVATAAIARVARATSTRAPALLGAPLIVGRVDDRLRPVVAPCAKFAAARVLIGPWYGPGTI